MKKWSWECHYCSWGGPWVPKGARDEKGSPRVVRWTPSPPKEGPQSGPKMVTLFFVGASGTLKKEVRERVQTQTSFWGHFGVSPEGENGAPVYTGAPFSLFSRTQKGLQNGSQNGAFWAPKSELYSLWGTIWEKFGPKKGGKNRPGKML